MDGKGWMWRLRRVCAGGFEECDGYSVDFYIVKSTRKGYGSLREVMRCADDCVEL